MPQRLSPRAGALLALALCFAALHPSPLHAQIELGPSIGLFWPLGGWTEDFAGDEVERRHIAAGVIIGRLTMWGENRLALEGTFGFSPSQVAVTDLNGTEDITAGVVMGSVRGLYRLGRIAYGDSGRISRWDFYGGLGLGVIARNGSAWKNHEGTTHPAGVFSIGTRTNIAGRVTLRVRMEDWVSWATFNEGKPSETLSRVQHDLVGTLGLMVHLGRIR